MAKVIYTMPIIGVGRAGPVTQPGPNNDVNVGNKYGQMGPNCWYYTAKLILKFHEMVTNETDETYGKLKALQEIRNLLIEGMVQHELDQQALQYLNAIAGTMETSPYGPVNSTFSSRLAKQSILEQLRAKLKLVEQDATQSLTKPQTLIAKEKMSVGTGRKHGATTDQRRNSLTAAIKVIAGIPADIPSRVDLLYAFFGDSLTFIDTQKWSLDTPDALFEILNTWGPFYAGGELATISGVKTPEQRQVNGQITKGSVAVKDYGSNKHAIVIHGVDTKTRTVFYTDPNYTCYNYEVDFNVIKDRVKPKQTSDGDVFVTANCPDLQHSLDGICQHMRNKRVYQE